LNITSESNVITDSENSTNTSFFEQLKYSTYFIAARTVYQRWKGESKWRRSNYIRAYERLKGIELAIIVALRDSKGSAHEKLDKEYKMIRVFTQEIAMSPELEGYSTSKLDRIPDQQVSEIEIVGGNSL
jgi:hypothetical protein